MSSVPSPLADRPIGHCPRCGRPLSPTPLGDQCAPCLFAAVLDEQAVLIGEYERLEKIGEGATGTVYLARHLDDDRLLALKLAKTEAFESGEALAAFRHEISTVAGLRHANIVPIHRIEMHEGRPFLVMELFAGGTLDDAENVGLRREPGPALEVMLKIARAVQFAHQRGFLHCDLKPANILLDEHGEPHVSDFGLARSISRPIRAGVPRFEGGTIGWMSPEQVERKPLTTASDRFSLGLILHWLRTGELLFGEGEDFKERVANQEREPPGPWTPGLAWALRAIVYRATQLEPQDRYASTAELVGDLERARDNRPLRAVPTPLRGRVWLWSRRHPFASAALGALLLLSLFVVGTAIFAAQKQSQELRRLVLDMNAYAASGQAASVLYQLREYADVIERAAADPRVHELALSAPPSNERSSPSPELACAEQVGLANAAPLAAYAHDFDSLLVVNTRGCSRARLPLVSPELEYHKLFFGWRDYFRGAERYGRRGESASHVARAFRSSVSQDLRFAISTPILEGGEWTGVVAATITARSTLEHSRSTRRETEERMTVLLGPFEGEAQRPAASAAPDFAILVHPALPRGEKHLLDPKYTERFRAAFASTTRADEPFKRSSALPQTIDDYVDPLLGGRWLAAFAPVGGTGYVVLVQVREAVALQPSDVLTRRLAGGLGVALGLALLVFAGLAWSAHRSRSPSGRADD